MSTQQKESQHDQQTKIRNNSGTERQKSKEELASNINKSPLTMLLQNLIDNDKKIKTAKYNETRSIAHRNSSIPFVSPNINPSSSSIQFLKQIQSIQPTPQINSLIKTQNQLDQFQNYDYNQQQKMHQSSQVNQSSDQQHKQQNNKIQQTQNFNTIHGSVPSMRSQAQCISNENNVLSEHKCKEKSLQNIINYKNQLLESLDQSQYHGDSRDVKDQKRLSRSDTKHSYSYKQFQNNIPRKEFKNDEPLDEERDRVASEQTISS